ncbi:MAG: hypothetical protein N2111_14505 [Candidatus Sumerlaeaceae bacterium]|nr:hypothetical protein [Candidatus Sumerlaeaceae bacterium]
MHTTPACGGISSMRRVTACILMTTWMTGATWALPSVDEYQSKYRNIDRPLPCLEILMEIKQELLGQPRIAQSNQAPGYTLDTADVPVLSSTVYGYMTEGKVRRVRTEEVNLRTGGVTLKDIAIDDSSRRELYIPPEGTPPYLMTSPGKSLLRDDALPLYAYFTRVHISPADLLFDSDDELEFRLYNSLALPEVVDEGMRQVDDCSYHAIRVGRYCRYYFDLGTRMLRRYEKLTKKGKDLSAIWELDDYKPVENADLLLPRLVRITDYAGGRAARRITIRVIIARATRSKMSLGSMPFHVPSGTMEVLK